MKKGFLPFCQDYVQLNSELRTYYFVPSAGYHESSRKVSNGSIHAFRNRTSVPVHLKARNNAALVERILITFLSAFFLTVLSSAHRIKRAYFFSSIGSYYV
jgi:hypothetical protein